MRVEQVQPACVRVTSDGHASLRVSGRGVGRLRCQGQSRWVFGTFDTRFRVTPEPGGLWIRGMGLWGGVRLHVPCEVAADLVVPRGVDVAIRAARPLPVLARPPVVPRTVSLDPGRFAPVPQASTEPDGNRSARVAP